MSSLLQASKHAVQGKSSVFALIHRVTVTLFGSYAFTWGFTAFGVAGLSAFGIDFHEAEMAMLIVAFLVITFIFIWAFATPNLSKVWLVLAGGAAVTSAAAWGLQKLILS